MKTTPDGSRHPLVVFILGSGRCGSTLLDMMLNAHPQIAGLGELSSIHFAAGDPTQAVDPATRDYWTVVADLYESQTGERFHSVDVRHPAWRRIRSLDTSGGAWVRRNCALFAAAAQAADAPIVTDSSKASQRLYLLEREGCGPVRVLHLCRDARAVANSYRRRYGSLAVGLRTWATSSATARFLRYRVPSERWHRLKYEDLATDPAVALGRICAFLDIPYAAEMLDFERHAYFGLAGSPTTREHMGAIALDERWKHELSSWQRAVIGVSVGLLNRLEGYPAFADD